MSAEFNNFDISSDENLNTFFDTLNPVDDDSDEKYNEENEYEDFPPKLILNMEKWDFPSNDYFKNLPSLISSNLSTSSVLNPFTPSKYVNPIINNEQLVYNKVDPLREIKKIISDYFDKASELDPNKQDLLLINNDNVKEDLKSKNIVSDLIYCISTRRLDIEFNVDLKIWLDKGNGLLKIIILAILMKFSVIMGNTIYILNTQYNPVSFNDSRLKIEDLSGREFELNLFESGNEPIFTPVKLTLIHYLKNKTNKQDLDDLVSFSTEFIKLVYRDPTEFISFHISNKSNSVQEENLKGSTFEQFLDDYFDDNLFAFQNNSIGTLEVDAILSQPIIEEEEEEIDSSSRHQTGLETFKVSPYWYNLSKNEFKVYTRACWLNGDQYLEILDHDENSLDIRIKNTRSSNKPVIEQQKGFGIDSRKLEDVRLFIPKELSLNLLSRDLSNTNTEQISRDLLFLVKILPATDLNIPPNSTSKIVVIFPDTGYISRERLPPIAISYLDTEAIEMISNTLSEIGITDSTIQINFINFEFYHGSFNNEKYNIVKDRTISQGYSQFFDKHTAVWLKRVFHPLIAQLDPYTKIRNQLFAKLEKKSRRKRGSKYIIKERKRRAI